MEPHELNPDNIVGECSACGHLFNIGIHGLRCDACGGHGIRNARLEPRINHEAVRAELIRRLQQGTFGFTYHPPVQRQDSKRLPLPERDTEVGYLDPSLRFNRLAWDVEVDCAELDKLYALDSGETP
jgi:hypothetical protein